MNILEGMTDEKPIGEDSIDGFIHCKDEAIEDVIKKYLMRSKQADSRKKGSELAVFRPPIGAKIKIDALDDIWSPSLELSSVSVLPAKLIDEKLTTDVSFSRNKSWIDASAQQDLVTSSPSTRCFRNIGFPGNEDLMEY